ncbi:MAG: DUF1127 domain-containing protein [Rhodospirillaceae bacterium]|nr:DUF1127 domain-containing protein [Rhodospirillaceae bacterium]
MANGKSTEGSTQTVRSDFCIAVSAFRRCLIGSLHVAETWKERSRQRRELATLGDAILKDLGLSRADVESECRKHFWRP